MVDRASLDFRSLLADAALQSFFMRVCRVDQDLKQAGWTTRYIIDSNILDLHLAPASNAAASEDRIIASGRIFTGDPPELQELVTAALGQFVCYGLEPDAPLLIMPPLHIEFRKAIIAYRKRAEDALSDSKERGAELKRVWDRISAQGYEVTPDDLKAFRQALLLAAQPHEQLRRLAFLFRKNRLANAHSPLDAASFPEPFHKALHRNPADHARTLDILESKALPK